MMPIALVLFGNYSVYHPLSVIWSILFTLFYPLTLLLHLSGFGDSLDALLQLFLSVELELQRFTLSSWWLIPYLLLAFIALWRREGLFLLLFVATGITVAAIYQVT